MSTHFPLPRSRPRLVIVEGPQGSGKTSLVRGLTAQIPNSVSLKKTPSAFKTRSPGFLAMTAALGDLNLVRRAQRLIENNPSLTVILDRAFLSNIVYTLLRESPNGEVSRDDLDSFLSQSGTLEILQEVSSVLGGYLVVMDPEQLPRFSRPNKDPHWPDWEGRDLSVYRDLITLLGIHLEDGSNFIVLSPPLVSDPAEYLTTLFFDILSFPSEWQGG